MGERWTATRIIEHTPGGQRINVTDEVVALANEAKILRGALQRIAGATHHPDEPPWYVTVAHEALKNA